MSTSWSDQVWFWNKLDRKWMWKFKFCQIFWSSQMIWYDLIFQPLVRLYVEQEFGNLYLGSGNTRYGCLDVANCFWKTSEGNLVALNFDDKICACVCATSEKDIIRFNKYNRIEVNHVCVWIQIFKSSYHLNRNVLKRNINNINFW